MRHPRRIRRPLGAVAMLVILAGLGGLGLADQAAAQGSGDDLVPVTIVYTTDVKGHIEPCG